MCLMHRISDEENALRLEQVKIRDALRARMTAPIDADKVAIAKRAADAMVLSVSGLSNKPACQENDATAAVLASLSERELSELGLELVVGYSRKPHHAAAIDEVTDA